MARGITRTVLLSFFLGAAAPLSGADWPAYRFDSARGGVTSDSISSDLNLQWVYQPNHPPIPAWPKPGEETPRMHTDRAFQVAIGNETVYFGSSVDHLLRALSTKDGATRWTFRAQGAIRFAPVLGEGKIFFGADDGEVYCLEAASGRKIWTYRPSPADERMVGNGRMVAAWPVRTGLVLDQGTIMVAAGVFPYEGLYIAAVDAATGKEIWKNDTAGDLAWGLTYGGMAPQGYLLLSSDRLYVPSGRAMPAAFDRKDGRFLRFLSPSGKVGGTWALVDGGELIAGVNQQGTPAKIVFDAETGDRRGDMFAQFDGIDMVLTPKTAYTVTETGVVAIDRQANREAGKKVPELEKKRANLSRKIGELRGQYKKLKAQQASGGEPAPADRKQRIRAIQTELVGRTQDVADIQQQEALYRRKTVRWEYERTGLQTIVKAGDTVVVGGRDILLGLDPSSGAPVFQKTPEGLVLGLAVGDSALVASTDTGDIYCYGESRVQSHRVVKEPIVEHPFQEQALQGIYHDAARDILEQADVTRGFCLVLDANEGRLAYEIASQSALKVVGIEHDPQALERARALIQKTGFYGTRVVIEPWNASELPDYFANLIVADRLLVGGGLSAPAAEVFRVLRPAGGVAMFKGATGSKAGRAFDIQAWAANASRRAGASASVSGGWSKFVRGKLEGSGTWNGLYGNVSNTGSSQDQLVKGPFGVLWYGEPGSEYMLDRHSRSVSPLAVNGRLFVQGMEIVMGYDAYNGTLLWRRKIPGAVRTRVDVDGSNIFATDDYMFVAAHDRTLELDAQTGETVREFRVPRPSDNQARRWGYLAVYQNVLFGSASVPLLSEYGSLWNAMVDGDAWKPDEAIPDSIKKMEWQGQSIVKAIKQRYPRPDEKAYEGFKRDGLHWRYVARYPGWGSVRAPGPVTQEMMVSDSIFAYDIHTGKLLWQVSGKAISQISVTVGEGKVFLVTRDLTEQEKEAAAKERRDAIQGGVYQPHDEENLAFKDKDFRRVVALDLRTGDQVWSKAMDLSGCGGDKLGAAYQDGRLLFFGHFSNHDQGPFAAGKLAWRRITVLNAGNGDLYWSKPLNYRRRPLVLNDTIFVEPRAASLTTGEIKYRQHPITGEKVPWEFLRPGHSCGIVTASPNSLFFRSYSAAIVNLQQDSGLQLFGGTRPGCWNSMIPANGLLTMQESSAGCTCSYALRTTVVLKNKKEKGPGEWTVFISNAPTKPVAHLALNFGAPGDMRDPNGTMWFAYPRPDTSDGQGPFKNYGVKFDLNENKGAKVVRRDFRGVTIAGSTRPWLYTTALEGLTELTIPLLEEGTRGRYRVRIGFAGLPHQERGQRVFDITLQGTPVKQGFDVMAVAGKPRKAVVLEFDHVRVSQDLRVQFLSRNASPSPGPRSLVQFLEVIREDKTPKTVASLNPLNLSGRAD